MAISIDLTQFVTNVDGSKNSNYPSGDKSNGVVSVSGTISDGQTLTISGYGFGSGCANSMFENYENGAVGSQVLDSNTNYDTSNAAVIAIRDADSRSGTKSASTFQQHSGTLTYQSASIIKTLDPCTEVFVSYAVKVPSGSNFPGNDGGNSGTDADYSTDASWKTCWIYDDNTGDNDIVTPSHIISGSWSHAGNDLGTLKSWANKPTWWKWGAWNRFTTWIKAGSTPNVDTGNLYFQVANGVDSIFQDSTTPVVFANGTAPYQFTNVNLHGWQRNRETLGGVKTLYDDGYIAWGDNAAARVELGNNAVYENCTDLAICDYTSWNGTSITTTCREGGLNLAQNTWLFVTLADNTTRYSYQVVTV